MVPTELAKLSASDDTGSSGFGFRLAISGDTIVVGAPDQAVGTNSGQGAVYVFRKAAGGWASGTEIAKLTHSDPRAADRFGASVAISGDTIVVGCGCPRGTPMLPAPGGAAYVFAKPPGGWASGTETAKLTPSDGAPGDAFSIAVAIDGDTIVIGGSGAYVFTEPVGGWATGTEQAKLTPSARGQGFSFSLAISGDTIVAGAQFDDLGAGRMCPCNQGSAFVFTKPASGWASGTETAKLIASDATGDGFFGRAVALSGNTIVVGALPMVGLSVGPGSAYVFTEPQSGWASGTETAKLTASDLAAGDPWGVSVAVSGDTVSWVGRRTTPQSPITVRCTSSWNRSLAG